jgi:hypothetical protein
MTPSSVCRRLHPLGGHTVGLDRDDLEVEGGKDLRPELHRLALLLDGRGAVTRSRTHHLDELVHLLAGHRSPRPPVNANAGAPSLAQGVASREVEVRGAAVTARRFRPRRSESGGDRWTERHGENPWPAVRPRSRERQRALLFSQDERR